MYINYDIQVGILFKWKRYVIVIVVFLFFCTSLYSHRVFANDLIAKEVLPTFIDYFIFIFEGVPPFNPKSGAHFTLPLMWILYNLTLAYIVGDYTTYELNHYGNNVLTRIKSRKKWWLAKCKWASLSVILFYSIGYVTILNFNLLVSRNISFTPNVMKYIFIASAQFETITVEFIFSIIILPIIVSLSITFLQMTLSLIFNSIISFIIITALFATSIYLDNGILISSGSMLIRNEIITSSGTKTTTILLFATLIALLSIITGLIYFEKYDILRKK